MDILLPYFCRIFLRKLIRQFSLMPTLQLHCPEKQTARVLQFQQQLRQMEWEWPSKMFIHKVATFWALDGKYFYLIKHYRVTLFKGDVLPAQPLEPQM